MTGSRWPRARAIGVCARPLLGAVLAAVLAPQAARAAAPVGTPVLRIERIDVSAPPRVRLFVTQVGQDGQVGRPPAPTSVKLVVDGQPLPVPELRVGTVKSVGEPLAVTFVLQDSSGMEAAFSEAQRSLLEIGDALPAGSRVGLVSFGKTVRTALDPQAFADVRGELARLTLDAQVIETQLGIGVGRGLDGLIGAKAQSLPTRRVLLVVAEGLTSSYERTEFTALASRAKDNNVRIHAVGYYKFGEPEQPTLALLSSLSKGTLRSYSDPAGVRDGLKGVGAELAEQWVLDMEQPALFDGLRHDFQLELEGGQASEVERVVIPASAVGKSREIKPALYGAAAALALAVLVIGGFLWSRRRKVEAQKVMQNLAPVMMEATSMTDARDIRAALGGASMERAPVVQEPPVRDQPVSVLPLMPSEPPPPVSERPPVGSGPMGPDMLALPSPTAFLRRFDLAEAEEAALAKIEPGLAPIGGPPTMPTPVVSPQALAFPPEDVTTPSLHSAHSMIGAEHRAPDPVVDFGSRAALSALSDDDPTLMPDYAPPPRAQMADATIPPQSGALRSALNARLESGAMMLKTQVLMPTEGTRSDAVAWLARLGARGATIPLVSGQAVGGVTFMVDQLSRWVMRTGEGMKLVADGEVLQLDGEVYVMKLATRLRPSPSGKDGLLLIVGGPDDGRVVALARGTPYVVGAHPRADVPVRGKQVAPQHLGVSVEGGKLRVADLGTADGFKVDGQQVWKAALAPSQELQVGTVRLVFQKA